MNITNTITVLELVWTIVAACGLVFMILLLHRSYEDREWLMDTKANGDKDLRQYVATTSFLIFIGGFVTQLTYTIVGIIAMTNPNLNNSSQPHLKQLFTSALFIISSCLGTIFAGIIYTRRIRITKAVLKKLHEKESHE